MREGWEIKKLADLCKTFADGDWIEKKDQSPSGIRLVQTGNVGNGVFRGKDDSRHYISQETFERLHCTEIFPGDILISRLPEPVGRGCLIPETGEKMITAVDCTIIRLNPGCLPQFLVYYSQSAEYQYSVREVSTGTTRQRISRKNLGEIGIPVPSLQEQQRIVDILDQEFAKIDALKANAEKSLQAAKDLFQATLKKELEPKEGWEIAEINSVCLKTDNIKWKDIPEEREYTYIDLTSVDRSTKSVVEPQRIRKSNAPSRAQRLVSWDDIIFATTRPTLRRYCIIPEQYDGQICSTGFCVLRPDKRKVRPSWLFHCLSADTFYDYVEPLQTGATYPAITDKDVKGYVISLPSIASQDEIISRLDDLNDKCQSLQENYQKTLTLCDDLKQALLRKAFNGEL